MSKSPTLTPYRLAAILSTVVVVGVTIAALFLIDSPMTERMRRFDDRRVSDLQSISYGVDTYVLKNKQALPESLEVLIQDRDLGYLENQIKDPETQTTYEYKKVDDKSYELCANFALSNKLDDDKAQSYDYRAYGPAWDHDAGRQCFTLTVRDPGSDFEDTHF